VEREVDRLDILVKRPINLVLGRPRHHLHTSRKSLPLLMCVSVLVGLLCIDKDASEMPGH